MSWDEITDGVKEAWEMITDKKFWKILRSTFEFDRDAYVSESVIEKAKKESQAMTTLEKVLLRLFGFLTVFSLYMAVASFLFLGEKILSFAFTSIGIGCASVGYWLSKKVKEACQIRIKEDDNDEI